MTLSPTRPAYVPSRALVIGASGGIGSALTAALRDRGSDVTALSRRTDGLDLTDESSIAAALSPLVAPYDLIFLATGALELHGNRPEKSLRALDPAALAAQFALNAIGPALVLKHALRLLPRDRPAHVAALSARVGSIGDNRLGGWYGYRAAKAALNQLVHTAAVEIARSHPLAVLCTLHPGTVETPLTRAYAAGHPTVSAATAAANLLAVLGALTPADTGGFFDWQGKAIPW
ncbi:SDR family NAD(P)-dependent oxidoreductase [Paragemmobacter straminiformis]|uniref:SDR family NAD(P)-dependent oxidoreductase n=1 Tax=Paragemmobacter straminiformis TaxID=2045119 RepID=A0A842I2J6_9RHOB|nr:SDR family NAD(P)-dependent oxidoreductase [Gemmobacter straminiformis]MBC2834170.1 SDR family NAD(P)-dependent oxidoreductase [Gemmobacter straminiformis]